MVSNTNERQAHILGSWDNELTCSNIVLADVDVFLAHVTVISED
jgi:hypothetical protein